MSDQIETVTDPAGEMRLDGSRMRSEFPDAVGITIGSGTIRDGVHYIHSVSECQELQRQANYRRVRLEVAARLMAGIGPNRWTVIEDVSDVLAAADELIAANEAAPVPAATGRSGPQSDDLPSTLPTAPSAGDRRTEGEQTAQNKSSRNGG